MITAANLKTRSSKDLAALAKRKGIPGWNAMKKDDLVKALLKQASGKSSSSKASAAKSPAAKASAAKSSSAKPSSSKGSLAKASTAKGSAKPKATTVKSAAKPAAAKSTTKAAAAKPASKGSAKASAKPAAKVVTPKSSAAKTPATKSAGAGSKAVKSEKPNKPAADATRVSKPKSEKRSDASIAVESRNGSGKHPVKSPAKSSVPVLISKSIPKPVVEEVVEEPILDEEPLKKTSPRIIRKIQEAHQIRGRRKDMASESRAPGTKIGKERCALLVRDPYWLQAYWEISRETVERAKVALAAHWHTAQPFLRLSEIDDVSTTSSAERVVREIPVHGGVCNWYIDVVDPPKTYRVALGYKTGNGKFHVLARSNKVTTPPPGAADRVDGNWSDIAENCEKIFALSGGYQPDNSDQQLRELFEERLRRPMGSPSHAQYGGGADMGLGRLRDFEFTVDAEMIVFGQTDATAYVTMGGEPVKLRPDGSFVVRLPLPDRRQVLPIVASSADGVEQRTTVLAVERNTKVMEPLIRENGDD